MSMQVQKAHVCEKYYVLNPATSKFENWKYLASIMNEVLI